MTDRHIQSKYSESFQELLDFELMSCFVGLANQRSIQNTLPLLLSNFLRFLMSSVLSHLVRSGPSKVAKLFLF